MLARRYTDLAGWYPLITDPGDYAEEGSFYANVLRGAISGEARTLLELGCGSGSNAFHYKTSFTPVLTDASASMLDLSKRNNPDCEHVLGDMRSLRLNRTFDAVLVHDAVSYMATRDDLRRAAQTAFVHLREGGAAIFVPDFTFETFEEHVEHGGRTEGPRALRYLNWSFDQDTTDEQYTNEWVYILREAASPSRIVHEAQECGLFARAVWLEILTEAGFVPSTIAFKHSEVPRSIDVFLAKR